MAHRRREGRRRGSRRGPSPDPRPSRARRRKPLAPAALRAVRLRLRRPCSCMVVLMLVPIVMVIGYSFTDNVIMKKDPAFAGIANYVEILTDPDFWNAVRNTALLHRCERRRAPGARPGVRDDAQHARCSAASPRRSSGSSTSCRGCSPSRSSRCCGGCCSTPTASSTTCCSRGLTDAKVEWLADPQLALLRRDLHQHLVRLPVLHDEPARRAAGHPARPVRGGDGRRRELLAALLERHAPAAAADHRQHGAARPHLDDAAVRAHLDDDRRRPDQRHRDAQHLHLQARLQPLRVLARLGERRDHPRCSRWCSPSSTSATRRRRD